VRILCFIVVMLAGVCGAHVQGAQAQRVQAQTPNQDRLEAGVAKAIAPTKVSKLFETPAVPERDSIEFAAQLLSEPFRLPNVQLETVSWAELEGWAGDDHAAAFETFLSSCNTMVQGTPLRHAGQPFYTALQSACRRAIKSQPRDAGAARIFFERSFRPMRIAPLGESAGFLTGYYEPIIEGSRVKNAEFNVPLYRTPPNLTKPYFERAKIENGALAGRKLEICWLKDPTDLFFAQIQGSARVKLVEDGKILRLNYSSHNGWPYTAIGGILIHREIVPREEMSMDRIREWIDANPKEGRELRLRNKSYVFFRETGLSEHVEPVGAQGISLTPGRSIAVDRTIHIYGTPFFIQAELPFDSENSENKFQRLMVAQDTGGAIRGPARADLYFGAGSGPAHVAGRIRHPGHFTILVPREIDPVIAGRNTPLPRPRPAFADAKEKMEMAAKTAAPEKALVESVTPVKESAEQTNELSAERRPEH
jgi:membrane-bound lytic murein transglycosylase A